MCKVQFVDAGISVPGVLDEAWEEAESAVRKLRRLPKAGRIAAVETASQQPGALQLLILLELMDDSAWEVREAAMQALGSWGAVVQRLAVRAALTDPEDTLRTVAAERLGEIGTKRDVPRLAMLLRDPCWMVRASALSSAAAQGGPDARRVVQAGLRDPDPNVRRYAAVALADIGDPNGSKQLEAALAAEKEPRALTGIHAALYTLGDGSHLAPLLDLLRAEDASVRHQVLTLIEHDLRLEDRQTVVAQLRTLLDVETNPGVQRHAEAVIELLRSEDA